MSKPLATKVSTALSENVQIVCVCVCVCVRLKTLLKTAKKQLREQGGGQLDPPLGSFRADMSHRLEAESTVGRMKTRVQSQL